MNSAIMKAILESDTVRHAKDLEKNQAKKANGNNDRFNYDDWKAGKGKKLGKPRGAWSEKNLLMKEGTSYGDIDDVVEPILSTSGDELGHTFICADNTYGFYHNRKQEVQRGFKTPEEARQAFIAYHKARQEYIKASRNKYDQHLEEDAKGGTWSEKNLLFKEDGPVGQTIPYEKWAEKSPQQQADLKARYPKLKVIGSAPKPPRAVKPKVVKQPKPRIPKFGDASPKNELEKFAKAAMYDVWQQIANDVMDMPGAEEEFQDPYYIQEICCDANRLQSNGGLSAEEEARVLSLSDKTRARLCSNFGF